MKNKIQALGVIALFVFGGLFIQSCEKIKDAVAFDVEQDMPAQNFEIDSTATSSKGDKLLYTHFFDVDLEKIFDENGIDAGTISNGQFKTITLTIDEEKNPGVHFGFVSSVRFELSLDANPENAVIIAEKGDINVGDTKITFDILEGDLDKYIEETKFYFYVYGVMPGELPTEKVDIIMNSAIKFTVSPLK